MHNFGSHKIAKPLGIVLLLCIPLFMKSSVLAVDVFPGQESIPEKEAILFMQSSLKPGSRVGTVSPGIVLCAKMNVEYLFFELRNMQSGKEISSWIIDKDLKAIYVDSYLESWEPELYLLLNEQIGKTLIQGYKSNDGRAEVLLVDRSFLKGKQ